MTILMEEPLLLQYPTNNVGVATLSPSASDSLELISPHSPCDLSSEPSDLSSCGSGRSPSSSSSSSSSSPLCDLGSELEQEVRQPIMAAVVVAPKPKVPVTNFISFQIPQLQQSPGFVTKQPQQFVKPKNVVQSSFNCDVRKYASTTPDIKQIIEALGTYETGETVKVVRKNFSDLKTNGRSVAEFSGKNGGVRPLPTLRGTTKSYLVRGDGQPSKVIILSGFPKVGSNGGSPSAFAVKASPPNKGKQGSLTTTSADKILVDLTDDDEDDEETTPSSSCSPAKKKCRLQRPVIEIIPIESTGAKVYSQRGSPTTNNSNSPQRVSGLKKTDPPEIVEVSSSTCTINSKTSRSPPPPPPLFNFGFRESCSSSTVPSLTVATPDSSTSEDHELITVSSEKPSPSSSSPSLKEGADADHPEDDKISRDFSGSHLSGIFVDSSLPTSSTSCGNSSIRCANPLSPSGSFSRKRKLFLDDVISVKSNSSSSSSNSNGSRSSSATLPVSTTNSKECLTAFPRQVFPVVDSAVATKKSERLLAKSSCKGGIVQEFCMWKDCTCATETNLNFLEHIQTVHVSPQTKAEGYVCLWEGCKVFNKKSCSLSWLERHVLSHGGNKPFRCIFPGCGLCFSAQAPLEKHVNSHIISNGLANGTNGHSSIAKKLDSSPSKNARRKKLKRKQKLNTGHVVDFFDKRTMEVIKYRLSSTMNFQEDSVHNCTFTSQVLSRQVTFYQEPRYFVRWHPESILPDEWIPQSKFVKTKSVPLRQLPPDKMKILFPNMFPPERKEKASRKWKPPVVTTNGTSANETGKRNWKKKKNVPACGCPQTSHDNCTPLEADWALFLAERCGTWT